MSETLARVQALAARDELRVSAHGYDELAADGILFVDILAGLTNAVLVEVYPEFGKGPCVLVLQKDSAGNPIHVVWGIPKGEAGPAVVVTAYRPDPEVWSGDFMRRRAK